MKGHEGIDSVISYFERGVTLLFGLRLAAKQLQNRADCKNGSPNDSNLERSVTTVTSININIIGRRPQFRDPERP